MFHTKKNMSDERAMPPATFEFLVFSLRTQAEMNMGLYHFGKDDDRPEPDLEVARHSIDLLGVLQEKTKGNLSLEEERLLNNSLTELRFRFVQVSAKKAETRSEESPRIIAPDDDQPRIIVP
jgi:hypothetical protein